MQLNIKDPNDLITEIGTQFFVDLRIAAGVNKDEFRLHYIPLIHEFGKYVQDLPFSKTHHCENGGAFKYAMTAAFLTMRMTGGVLFATNFSSEKMKKVLPQYVFSTFAISLVCTLIQVFANTSIKIQGIPWSYLAVEGSLYGALTTKKQTTYDVDWKVDARKTNLLAMVLCTKLFKPGIWHEWDYQILVEMIESINVTNHVPMNETQMAKIVRLGHEKALSLYESDIRTQYSVGPTELRSIDPVQLTVSSVVAVQVDVPDTSPHTEAAPAPIVQSKDTNAAPSEAKAPAFEYPGFFNDWLHWVKNDETRYSQLIFNENGTVTVPLKAILGCGIEPREFADNLLQRGIVTEKNGKARTITLHSDCTSSFTRKD